ncbi:MAG: flagellar hook-associated protein FlgK [Planctomycetota bacterium]
MSLFSSLNLARLALGAHQTAIQTVGQNIANAATPGYARQRVHLTPTPSDDLVYARLGTGVNVSRIERIVDQHLEATLRGARSDLANLTEQNRIWSLTESIFNDLEGGGLSEALGEFFDAMQDLSVNPDDPTARSLLLEQGSSLSSTFRFLDARVRDLRIGLDEDVRGEVLEINRLTAELASLNSAIIAAEDGGVHGQTANDLRTQRDVVLGELAERIDIRVIENSTGGVQVLTGSEMLVHDGISRDLQVIARADGDIPYGEVRFADDGTLLQPEGGRIAALLAGRDAVLPDLRAQLDGIASTLIRGFNAIHSGGEGLSRLTEVLSSNSVNDREAPLISAGLPFPVESGSFVLQVVTEGNGAVESFNIDLDVDSMSLVDIAERINETAGVAHPGLSAVVTADGRLEIQSSDPGVTFTFRDDDTGALAALGVNGLFTGSTARDIDISSVLLDDPGLLAAGFGGGAGDNGAINAMLALRDEGLFAAGNSFEGHYGALVGEIGLNSAEAREHLTNQVSITTAIQNQRESLSGVNIDEEAISLVSYQRAYPGAARFLNVVDRLLETLINSV